MKTYKDFIQETTQLKEFNLGGIIKSGLKSAGQSAAVSGVSAGIKKLTGNNPVINKAVDIGTAGIGYGRLAGPGAVGATIGSEVLAPAAIKLAKQRRADQQQRRNSLVPGNTSVSGKPAQIIPTK